MNDEELIACFRKNPDGSWTSITPFSISAPGGSVNMAAGQTFTRGAWFMGVNLATMLDEAEKRRGVGTPSPGV